MDLYIMLQRELKFDSATQFASDVPLATCGLIVNLIKYLVANLAVDNLGNSGCYRIIVIIET